MVTFFQTITGIIGEAINGSESGGGGGSEPTPTPTPTPTEDLIITPAGKLVLLRTSSQLKLNINTNLRYRPDRKYKTHISITGHEYDFYSNDLPSVVHVSSSQLNEIYSVNTAEVTVYLMTMDTIIATSNTITMEVNH